LCEERVTKIIFEGSGRGGRKKRDHKLEFIGQMQEAGFGDWKPHQFALRSGRKWEFDWALPELKIAVEYEGGLFGKGGGRRCPACNQLPKGEHFMIDRIVRDAEKYNEAAIMGWCVIRVLPKTVDSGLAILTIKRAVMVRKHWKGRDDER
jgi:hypothetical protein